MRQIISNSQSGSLVRAKLNSNFSELYDNMAEVGASPGGETTNIQFNDGGVFGGVSTFTFDKNTNYLMLGVEGADCRFFSPDATSDDTPGSQLSMFSGSGKGNAPGGDFQISAGHAGSGTANAGGFFFNSGNGGGTGGDAGGFQMICGSANVGIGGGFKMHGGNGGMAGGPVTVSAGDCNDTGGGGDCTFLSGPGGLTSGKGGNVIFAAGDARAGDSDGGNITLTPGAASGAGIVGHVMLNNLEDFADDTAAATGNVPVNGMYRNGSVLQIRVS